MSCLYRYIKNLTQTGEVDTVPRLAVLLQEELKVRHHFLLICAQPVPTNILDRSNLTRVADQNHHIDRIRIRFQGILKPVRDPDPTVHKIKEVAKYLFFLKM